MLTLFVAIWVAAVIAFWRDVAAAWASNSNVRYKVLRKFQSAYPTFQFEPVFGRITDTYFDELERLLDYLDPREEYPRISSDQVEMMQQADANLKCSYNCDYNKSRAIFGPSRGDSTTQIILGRFYDTLGCFYDSSTVFAMAMNPYSTLKNDLFVWNMVAHPEYYINSSAPKILHPIFPVRIIISNLHVIPKYKRRSIDCTGFVQELAFDTSGPVPRKALMDCNIDVLKSIPKNYLLRKITAEVMPESHVISREIILLMRQGMSFYVVLNQNGIFEPFILVSKLSLQHIRQY